jgi:hypothetical protein
MASGPWPEGLAVTRESRCARRVRADSVFPIRARMGEEGRGLLAEHSGPLDRVAGSVCKFVDGRHGSAGSARVSRGNVVARRRSDRENSTARRRRLGRRLAAHVALCTSLCTGVHSARPLNPDVGPVSTASGIRPRPPYVTAIGGLAGSDPVLGGCRDQGSAGGRGTPELDRKPNTKTTKTGRTKKRGNGSGKRRS